MTWTGSFPTATGFTIQRATNTGFTTGLTTFTPAATATTYTDTTSAGKTTYCYRVLASNSHGNSAPSNTATVLTNPPPVPLAVTSATATAATQSTFQDKITVSWVNPAGNNQTNFRIQYARSSTFTTGVTTVAVAGTATSYVITNLPRHTAYYVRVQAYNIGGASAYVTATPSPVTTP